MAPLPAWKKVLYLKQPYDDNYVDSSFLDSLKVNAHLQKYEFWALWHDALSIIFQLSLVVMFLNVWWRMQQSLWNLQGLLVLDGILFGGFILGWRREHTVEALLDVLQAAKIIFPLWVLAPLLQTLTRSWSDDTIAAIASILLVLHVASFRYKDSPVLSQGSASTAASPGAVRSLAGGPTALNAAMLAATILASRLLTAQEVFAFMSFAMEVFVLPRRRIAALFPAWLYFLMTLRFSHCIFLSLPQGLDGVRPLFFLFMCSGYDWFHRGSRCLCHSDCHDWTSQSRIVPVRAATQSSNPGTLGHCPCNAFAWTISASQIMEAVIISKCRRKSWTASK
ncbi:unnamed protein product [Durusdinium trenchii]|uniref:Uncharacterized protein n=2 Tax=Durusdinium trenchii TaxID=1381693 RepID=A0ABP0I5C7_9DINO